MQKWGKRSVKKSAISLNVKLFESKMWVYLQWKNVSCFFQRDWSAVLMVGAVLPLLGAYCESSFNIIFWWLRSLGIFMLYITWITFWLPKYNPRRFWLGKSNPLRTGLGCPGDPWFQQFSKRIPIKILLNEVIGSCRTQSHKLLNAKLIWTWVWWPGSGTPANSHRGCVFAAGSIAKVMLVLQSKSFAWAWRDFQNTHENSIGSKGAVSCHVWVSC